MIDFIKDHGVLIVALLAVVEGVLCAILLRRMERLHARLRVAVAAAEDAARAATLALPGGIDPEIVIQLLRSGRPASLETVYQLMERQAAAEEVDRQRRLDQILPATASTPTPVTAAPSTPAAPPASPPYASSSAPAAAPTYATPPPASPPYATPKPPAPAAQPPTTPPAGGTPPPSDMEKRLGRYG